MSSHLKIIFIVLGLCAATYFIPGDYELALVFTVFLLTMAYHILQNIKRFVKVKRSIVVKGELLEYTKNKNDDWQYTLKVKYQDPQNLQEHIGTIEVRLLQTPDYYKDLRVAINRKNPNRSIIVNQFGLFWSIYMFVGIGLMVYFACLLWEQIRIMLGYR